LKTPTRIKVNFLKYYPADNSASVSNKYEKETEYNEEVTLKIGDADATIQGLYIYEIDYVVKNGINYFEDHDELYWNIIGTGWTIPIEKVNARIHLPGKIEKTACYTGLYGNTESNCELTELSDTVLSLSTKESLDTNEAVTIAVAMPKGSIDDVREEENKRIAKTNILGMSSFALIPLVYFFISKKLRSKKLVVAPTYTPPKNMNPLMAGYLLFKGAPKPKVITAEIINLAVQGHLEIEQKEKKEYILRKTEPTKDIKLLSSAKLYNSLFLAFSEISTKSKSTALGEKAKDIWEETKNECNSYGYIDSTKNVGSTISTVLGFFALIGGFAGLSFFSANGSSLGGLAILITGISIFIASFTTDTRSDEGNRMYHELLGLKMYINTAEKHRIEFHNDPKKYMGIFETLLPYAIIFGLEKKWMKEFEDLYTESPDWYKGDISTFNTYHLMNSLSGISKGITTPAFETGGGFSSGGSGFGGGGFSGGGGGGGGGGSW